MDKFVVVFGLAILLVTMSPFVLNSDPADSWSFISGFTSLVTSDPADDLFPNTFMDSSGTVHAVFQSNRDEPFISRLGSHPESFDVDNWNIYYTSSSDNITWSAPVAVDTDTASDLFPDIVVDSKGTIHVTWHSNRLAEPVLPGFIPGIGDVAITPDSPDGFLTEFYTSVGTFSTSGIALSALTNSGLGGTDNEMQLGFDATSAPSLPSTTFIQYIDADYSYSTGSTDSTTSARLGAEVRIFVTDDGSGFPEYSSIEYWDGTTWTAAPPASFSITIMDGTASVEYSSFPSSPSKIAELRYILPVDPITGGTPNFQNMRVTEEIQTPLSTGSEFIAGAAGVPFDWHVFYANSTDDGTTWSTSEVVGDTSSTGRRDDMHPHIALGPTTNETVFITYMTNRNSDVTMGDPEDSGTFEYQRLTTPGVANIIPNWDWDIFLHNNTSNFPTTLDSEVHVDPSASDEYPDVTVRPGDTTVYVAWHSIGVVDISSPIIGNYDIFAKDNISNSPTFTTGSAATVNGVDSLHDMFVSLDSVRDNWTAAVWQKGPNEGGSEPVPLISRPDTTVNTLWEIYFTNSTNGILQGVWAPSEVSVDPGCGGTDVSTCMFPVITHDNEDDMFVAWQGYTTGSAPPISWEIFTTNTTNGIRTGWQSPANRDTSNLLVDAHPAIDARTFIGFLWHTVDGSSNWDINHSSRRAVPQPPSPPKPTFDFTGSGGSGDSGASSCDIGAVVSGPSSLTLKQGETGAVDVIFQNTAQDTERGRCDLKRPLVRLTGNIPFTWYTVSPALGGTIQEGKSKTFTIEITIPEVANPVTYQSGYQGAAVADPIGKEYTFTAPFSLTVTRELVPPLPQPPQAHPPAPPTPPRPLVQPPITPPTPPVEQPPKAEETFLDRIPLTRNQMAVGGGLVATILIIALGEILYVKKIKWEDVLEAAGVKPPKKATTKTSSRGVQTRSGKQTETRERQFHPPEAHLPKDKAAAKMQKVVGTQKKKPAKKKTKKPKKKKRVIIQSRILTKTKTGQVRTKKGLTTKKK